MSSAKEAIVNLTRETDNETFANSPPRGSPKSAIKNLTFDTPVRTPNAAAPSSSPRSALLGYARSPSSPNARANNESDDDGPDRPAPTLSDSEEELAQSLLKRPISPVSSSEDSEADEPKSSIHVDNEASSSDCDSDNATSSNVPSPKTPSTDVEDAVQQAWRRNEERKQRLMSAQARVLDGEAKLRREREEQILLTEMVASLDDLSSTLDKRVEEAHKRQQHRLGVVWLGIDFLCTILLLLLLIFAIGAVSSWIYALWHSKGAMDDRMYLSQHGSLTLERMLWRAPIDGHVVA